MSGGEGAGGSGGGPRGKAGTNTTRTLYVLLRGCAGGVAGDFVFLPTCGVERLRGWEGDLGNQSCKKSKIHEKTKRL